MHFTGRQLKAGRALLRITARQLAEMAGVNVLTIIRAEAENGPVSMKTNTYYAVKNTLEKGGVRFIETDEGSGVIGVDQ